MTTNKEANKKISLWKENQELKKELQLYKTIIEYLKMRGCEPDVIYAEYYIKNNL